MDFNDTDDNDPSPHNEVLRAAAYAIGACIAVIMFGISYYYIISYWVGAAS